MFNISPPFDQPQIHPLFAPLETDHLIITTALEGRSPARVWVDDPTGPRSAMMESPEGCYLVGDAGNAAFNRALAAYIDAHLAEQGEFVFACDPDADWAVVLADLYPARPFFSAERFHFTCDRMTFDWRAAMEPDWTLRQVDAVFLAGEPNAAVESVREAIETGWGSQEQFLRDGFGFVLMMGETPAAWSVCDCASGSRCEIGIQTVDALRLRGLGRITSAAAAEHALTHGFAQVGWHCWAHNLGSVRIAEQIGFQRAAAYMAYALYDPYYIHYAVQGNVQLHRGDAAGASAAYVRALHPQMPPRLYVQAARAAALSGEPEMAFEYLRQAVDRGWREIDRTRASTDFADMHDLPGWDELVVKVQEN